MNLITKTLLSILLLLSFQLNAQTGLESKILGSWKLIGYDYGNFFTDDVYVEYLSFYPDQKYQIINYPFGLDSAKTVKSGKWEIEKKGILQLKENKQYSNYYNDLYTYSEIDNGEIVEISDTLLIIIGYEGRKKLFIHYKRIPTLEKSENSDLQFQGFQQNEYINPFTFYLINCGDTNNKVMIKNYRSLEFDLSDMNLDTSIYEYKYITIYGTLRNVSDSTISINMNSEHIDYSKHDGSSSIIYNNYNGFDDFAKKDIQIGEINYIKYTSPFKDKLNTTGTFIIGYSAITALLIAPLVSIDYKSGGFNEKRYFTVAGIGLSGVAIGIPLTLFSDGKKFRIGDFNATNSSCYWYIKKE